MPMPWTGELRLRPGWDALLPALEAPRRTREPGRGPVATALRDTGRVSDGRRDVVWTAAGLTHTEPVRSAAWTLLALCAVAHL